MGYMQAKLGDLLGIHVTKQPVHSGKRPKFPKLQQNINAGRSPTIHYELI